jgi:hypothetical protein
MDRSHFDGKHDPPPRSLNRADPDMAAFERLAVALAEWPSLTGKLLVRHPVTGGACPACSIPGGRIVVPSPCALRALAEMAGKIHTEHGKQ